MIRRVLILLACLAAPATAEAARDSLGIFERWGAFRDSASGADGPRCFAVAEPVQAGGGAGWRPFAAIAAWPRRGIRGQLHIRLSRAKAANASATLTVGQRRFRLVGGGADAWGPDRSADAAIIATIRSGTSMSVESVGTDGRAFADVYALRGAATAIDAAALGCAGR